MATIKFKFRPSTKQDGLGTLYFQVIHHKQTKLISSGFHLHSSEWDASSSSVLCKASSANRQAELLFIQYKLNAALERMQDIIRGFEAQNSAFTTADILAKFTVNKERTSGGGFVLYCEKLIAHLSAHGRRRAAEKLRTCLNSFLRFLNDEDVSFADFTPSLMEYYEQYLRNKNLCANTRSFYMRNLRVAYNMAVEEGLCSQGNPFRRVYTGIAKTRKRALTFNDMRRIKHLDLSSSPKQAFARDVFLLSFLMRGIPLIDLAFLRKENLQHNIIQYHRRKTDQRITLMWEDCMQQIADRLWVNAGLDRDSSPFLLPLIPWSCKGQVVDDEEARRIFLNTSHRINRHLHEIGSQLRLPLALTSYVSRHSWASIAKRRNIPLSIISEGLGHDSERTTEIYLASIDSQIVDAANRRVWKGL